MRMQTPRLTLRELTPDDFEALYRVLGDSDVSRHYPYTFDEQRVRGWIDRNIKRYEVFGFGLWAVILKETGELIGDCGLTMQNINGFIRPEIGYHIRKDLWRRGYAKEAACMCRDWAFEHLPFGVLYSYMKYDNVASRATAMASGMCFVGEYPDPENEKTAVYEITRARWRAMTQ